MHKLAGSQPSLSVGIRVHGQDAQKLRGRTQISNLYIYPDLVVQLGNSLHVLELTICHETNLQKSQDYKKSKYASLSCNLSTMASDNNYTLSSTFFLQVSPLGFLSDMSHFLTSLKIAPMPPTVVQNLRKAVTDHSFQIYCNRNSDITPICL